MTGISQRIEFPGSAGQRLAALLDRPADTPRAYALFAHCFTCSKDSLAAARVGQALAARGIAVLRFDFTGLGSSTGDFSNTNFSSNIDDLLAGAAYLRQHYAAPGILVGHSLGGAAILAAAGRVPEAMAVATIAAPFRAEHIRDLLADDAGRIETDGEADVILAGRTFRIRKQLLDDVDRHNSPDAIAHLCKPLLIFHSPLDKIVDIENATEIFQAARHPKSFVSLDEADHLLTRKSDAAFVADVLAAWAGRYVADAVPATAPASADLQWGNPADAD